jgi:hypothetical protein
VSDGIGFIAVGDPASDPCPCGCGSTRLAHVNSQSDDDFERELWEAEQARYAADPPLTEEERRRMNALCSYRCPDHGRDLAEYQEPDGDETGTWINTRYRCPEGCDFGSHYDPAGGWCPVDHER